MFPAWKSWKYIPNDSLKSSFLKALYDRRSPTYGTRLVVRISRLTFSTHTQVIFNWGRAKASSFPYTHRQTQHQTLTNTQSLRHKYELVHRIRKSSVQLFRVVQYSKFTIYLRCCYQLMQQPGIINVGLPVALQALIGDNSIRSIRTNCESSVTPNLTAFILIWSTPPLSSTRPLFHKASVQRELHYTISMLTRAAMRKDRCVTLVLLDLCSTTRCWPVHDKWNFSLRWSRLLHALLICLWWWLATRSDRRTSYTPATWCCTGVILRLPCRDLTRMQLSSRTLKTAKVNEGDKKGENE